MLARDTRARARLALRGHWGVAVGVALVAALLGVGGAGFGGGAGAGGGGGGDTVGGVAPEGAAGALPGWMPGVFFGVLLGIGTFLLIYSIVTFVLGGAVRLGLCRFNIDLVAAPGMARFSTLFSRFHIFGRALLLQLLMWLFIFLWSLLFVIPGIIAAYRYAMAPYIMAENPDITPLEAIARSKAMMHGHKWRLFCLQFSFIGWYFLAVLTLGVGFIWLNPYIYAAEAVFYLNLDGRPGAQPDGMP